MAKLGRPGMSEPADPRNRCPQTPPPSHCWPPPQGWTDNSKCSARASEHGSHRSLLRQVPPPAAVRGSGPAAASRRTQQRQFPLLHRQGRVAQRLGDVVGLKVAVLSEDLGDRHPVGHHRHNRRHREPQVPHARHTTHPVCVHGHSFELHVPRPPGWPDPSGLSQPTVWCRRGEYSSAQWVVSACPTGAFQTYDTLSR